MKIILTLTILLSIPSFANPHGEESSLAEELREAKMVPHIGKDGKVDGYRVVKIKKGGVYEKMGLKKGDIVRNVDGEAVDSPQKAMEIYQELKKKGKLQLQTQ